MPRAETRRGTAALLHLARPGTLALAALIGAPGVPGMAEGPRPAPFHDAPRDVLAVAALDLARAAAVADGDAGSGEDREAGLALVLPRLMAEAPDAARAVQAALAEGGDAGAALDRAAEALGPDAPDLSAAALAWLLVSEAGLAEAYEEAVGGEAEAYALGHALLGRVEARLDTLRPDLTDAGRTEADEALAALRALWPAARPPAEMSPDPEEAEAPAHLLIGVLERDLALDLYPGRDLGRAAVTIADLAATGCAGDAGALLAGVELYHAALAPAFGVMAPEAAEGAAEAFETLTGRSGDDDDDDDGDEDDRDDDARGEGTPDDDGEDDETTAGAGDDDGDDDAGPEDAAQHRAAACATLGDTLAEARTTFAPMLQ